MTKTATGGAFPAWRVEPFLAIGSSVERFQIVDCNDKGVMVTSFRERAERIATAVNAYEPNQARIEALSAALRKLVGAKALSGVRELVAGWNGEGRPDGPYKERHPSRLGARIETNCGRIYELDEIMQEARAALEAKP